MAQDWQKQLPEAQGSLTVKESKKVLYRSPAFFVRKRDVSYQVLAVARWDDRCGNGSNSFYTVMEVVLADTDTVSESVGMYDISASVRAAIPKYLFDLQKWNGCHPFGPWSYMENTLYHAGDLDCYGLRAGERKQIVNGSSNMPAWQLVAVSNWDDTEVPLHTLTKYKDATEQPECDYRLEYRPWCRVGEGKKRELDYARSSAIWPDATDAQLTDENLATALKQRLPGLLVEFRTVIEGLGFTW